MSIKSRIAAMALLVVVLPMACAHAQSGDIAGARDYPGIGRFDGSRITGYRVRDFDATRLQAAPFAGNRPTDERRLEGAVTRIAYRAGPGPSMLEVSRNFENQLAQAGFETLLACDVKECGGLSFARALDVLPLPQMVVDGFSYRYYAGRRNDGDSETYATLVVSKNNADITMQLTMTVVGIMENRMLDAAAMAKGLGESGHIAIYGIYFDFDKADVKPESEPQLAELAGLLRDDPKLRVLVVGHTDGQGAFDYNLSLSQRRAQAVVDALVSRHGIMSGRLTPAGAGMVAPVASNRTEDGRTRNRRVEIVELVK